MSDLYAYLLVDCPLRTSQNPSSTTLVNRGSKCVPHRLYTWGANSQDRGCGLRDDGLMGESQLAELRNMRVLLEEARMLARDLAYHRRARLEAVIARALEEVDRQIEELRREGRN